MKNLLKLGLAVFGIVAATIASSTNVTAQGGGTLEPTDPTGPVGGCSPTVYVCGVTAGGTTLKGSWVE